MRAGGIGDRNAARYRPIAKPIGPKTNPKLPALARVPASALGRRTLAAGVGLVGLAAGQLHETGSKGAWTDKQRGQNCRGQEMLACRPIAASTAGRIAFFGNTAGAR